ncbi:hypothetical protein [Nocardia sp. alder85J]|uniref:hypothetical protein n=1 Tax=Nocardia sp. alder85J TaxID=2862949 RepID=UPI001CD352E5|nr:hypothetical protein [Nocardia sp. alder85J]MCX4098228.1 hypothetical protein [Nocardia sp. alder85J]
MDPVTIIVAALAAGAAKGVGDTASKAVADAYQSLKSLVAGKFSGKPKAGLILAEHEAAPADWEKPLATALREAGATDDEIVAAAEHLLNVADASPAGASRFHIDARGAAIGAIGDHNRQQNVFGAPVRDTPESTD